MSGSSHESQRRRRLEALTRSIRGGDMASAGRVLAGCGGRVRPPVEPQPPAAPLTVEQLGCGEQAECMLPQGLGRFWLIRRPLADVAPGSLDVAARYCQVMRGAGQRLEELSASRELCIASDCEAGDLLFMDIETCGLGAMPVFLIGTMTCQAGDLVFEQLLARDYSQEAAVVQAFCQRWERSRLLVTFNGKSFDVNMIRERAAFHRLDWPAQMPPHLDLLHESRRRWRGRLPNCRLQTLEAGLLGRRRVDDIPGAAIPQAYHDFVASGDARQLGKILHHNLLDLLTMAELVCLMLTGQDPLA